MDDGAESTMTKHSREDRRYRTRWLDDEYPSGQYCFRQHRAPHLPGRKAPGGRGRPRQPGEAGQQGGEIVRPAR
jgi:hypothetical protein